MALFSVSVRVTALYRIKVTVMFILIAPFSYRVRVTVSVWLALRLGF